VRFERGGFPLHVNLHIGTVMSLPRTATGRVFCAYTAPSQLQHILLAQVGQDETHPSPPPSSLLEDASFQQNLMQIRQRGMERGINAPSPGVSSLSAPVFDARGNLCLALTIIGSSGHIDVEWDGSTARTLAATALAIGREIASLPAGRGFQA
jgi:DNA-binding IclR family transcriptional regulator